RQGLGSKWIATAAEQIAVANSEAQHCRLRLFVCTRVSVIEVHKQSENGLRLGLVSPRAAANGTPLPISAIDQASGLQAERDRWRRQHSEQLKNDPLTNCSAPRSARHNFRQTRFSAWQFFSRLRYDAFASQFWYKNNARSHGDSAQRRSFPPGAQY